MTQEKLNEILMLHTKWLSNEPDGKRADLRCADLSSADLSSANLSGADLRFANLSDANLRCANLSDANLICADLSSADLSSANLRFANLSDANLSDANLSSADLSSADLSSANLRFANLSDANLSSADLSDANLRCADLSGADLRFANLSDANLRFANLSDANLICANLSGCKGLLSAVNFMESHFERTEEGYIVYKCFNGMYDAPSKWNIELGSIIEEEVNPNRTDVCGCGINVAPIEWVKQKFSSKTIYKLLIRWEWLPGVVVPYNTDGKIRCSKAQILEVVNP